MNKRGENRRGKGVYAFVDAANLFYGGVRSLHFRLDYEKLLAYLKLKFGVTKVFYYAGVDVESYKEEGKEIDLAKLVKFFEAKLKDKELKEEEKELLEKQLERARFFGDLDKWGYELRIKQTKTFTNSEGTTTKANCDVDLTFDMMRLMSQYSEAVVMSGDGDFAPVVEYLKDKKKKIWILARTERTAREMRELGGENFVDFKSARKEIEKRTEKTETEKKSPARTVPARGGGEKGKEVRRRIPTFRKGF